MRIPTTRPFFSEEDIEAILDEVRLILRSGQLILGPYTQRLEESFREYCGVKYAVGVSSCTAALEIALRYFDVVGKEVIVPTNTFIATCNSVIFSGGTPVLADIKPDTLCLDPTEITKKITPRTKGVIVVHIAGLPCPEIEEIRDICQMKGLFLLEDVAHAPGGMISGRKTGSFGDSGCFSFYPTKVMTTCTGGMITTNDYRLAEYAISLRHQGVGNRLHHIVNLGNDWLLNEVSAVLGIYQLRALENNLARRNEIAQKYAKAFSDLLDIKLFSIPPHIRHSYYKYAIRLSPNIDKQEIIEKMEKRGVGMGSIYDPPCHLMPVYQRLFGFHAGMFPAAETTLKQTCCLPIFPQMTEEEINYVIHSFQEVLAECRKSKAEEGVY